MFIMDQNCREEVLENGVKRKIKGHINDLMVVELTWKKGMVGAIHSHPHRQCAYVIKGSFEAEMDGQKQVLKAGDCLYAEADIPHGMVALEDDCVLLDIFTPMREDFLNK